MSIRIKIAKWLEPELVERAKNLEDLNGRILENSTKFQTLAFRAIERIGTLERAMRQISSARTPGANATVKRMADIADAALNSGEPK